MKQILFIACLFVFFAAVPVARSAQSSPRVDPRVLTDTADGATAHFLVILKSQPDTRTLAARAPNHQARGRVVFDMLRQTADATQPAVRAQLDTLSARYRAYWIVNMLAVEGDRTIVDMMAARTDVLAIESNRAFRVPLETTGQVVSTATGVEWNISKVNAPAVWARGYIGQNRVYANADTGVQWDHPALMSHYRGWNGVTADHNYNWWDAIKTSIAGGSSCGYDVVYPCDDHGHGTHTTGTGIGDDGAANQIGMAPGARWIACRNMDRGFGRPETFISCFQFFLAPTDLSGSNPDPDKRPDAVGNSYSCPPDELCSAHSLQTALENLRAAGVFMAVAAGNEGPDCSTIAEPPGLEPSAITVGATDSADAIVGFSNRGPVTVDGSNRRKPDLVAPGFDVRSSTRGGGYGPSSGTSMATPHIAGAVVLLWSAFPQLQRDVFCTQLLLQQSAVHHTSTQGCGGDTPTQVPNNVYGYGRLDVLAAFDAMSNGQFTCPKIYLPLVQR